MGSDSARRSFSFAPSMCHAFPVVFAFLTINHESNSPMALAPDRGFARDFRKSSQLSEVVVTRYTRRSGRNPFFIIFSFLFKFFWTFRSASRVSLSRSQNTPLQLHLMRES